MGNAAFIVWRETIEAMLVVGILHGWLAAHSGLLLDQRRRALRNLTDKKYIASRNPDGIFPGVERNVEVGASYTF